MSKRTSLSIPCSLFVATTLSLSLGGCDVDDGDAGDASEQNTVSADLAPDALDRLGAEFHVLDAASLDLSGEATEEARRRLAGVDAVGIDFGKLDRADTTALKALSQAAMEEDVPVIVQDVEADELAELIGVGVEASVAVITTLGPNGYRVFVFGGGDGEAAASSEGDGGELLESPDDDVTPLVEWSPDTVSLAVEQIGETLRHSAVTRLQSVPERSYTTPTNGYLYYDFDMAEESFSPVSGQTASLSMDFEAELALDTTRSKKVVFFRPTGSGQHPGTLISDGSTDRGYYQESQKVSLAPSTSSVSLYQHAPATANASTSYTSSTGYTIGSESGWPMIGYSASDETTTTLSDFSMVNNTSGSTASWTFAMTSSWTSMYSQAAFEKCKVKSLPALAKSNLNPQYEAYYRADSSFTGSMTFTFTKQTLLRRITRGGDIFTCKKHSNLWTIDRSRSVSINFGAV